METFSVLLAICAGNSPVIGEFPAQRPEMRRSFDVFFYLCLNKRLSKQSWGWCFEMPSCPLWHHYNAVYRQFWPSSGQLWHVYMVVASYWSIIRAAFYISYIMSSSMFPWAHCQTMGTQGVHGNAVLFVFLSENKWSQNICPIKSWCLCFLFLQLNV